MTLNYNGSTYAVEPDSTYKDIIIRAGNLTQACSIATAVNSMTSYEFNLDSYTNMIVKKIMIVIENGTYTVRISTREQTELEKAHSEIQEMYSAIQDLNVSEEEAVKHPCLFPDIHSVETVIPGNYYLVDGEVCLITDVIDEEAEGQYVSRPAKGGK